MKPNRKSAAPEEITEVVSEESGYNFNPALAAAAQLKSRLEQASVALVNRESAMNAAALCLLTRSHLMLVGEPGLAKSKMASVIFDCFSGSRMFHKQLMKETERDEIFGPMDSRTYREKAQIRYNISGMLPDCQFAFLDEIYRASGSLLPSMLEILNERRFLNGTESVSCPLHSAIATTNFITRTEELSAFEDRFLVHFRLQRLSRLGEQLTMLRLSELPPEPPEPMAYSALLAASKAVPKVSISTEMAELMLEVISAFSRAVGNRYISDRRVVQCLSLVKANALYNGREAVAAEDLNLTSLGLMQVNESATETSAFETVFTAKVGTYLQQIEESALLTEISQTVSFLTERYDSNLTRKQRLALLGDSFKTLRYMEGISPAEAPKTQQGKDNFGGELRRITELVNTLKREAEAN